MLLYVGSRTYSDKRSVQVSHCKEQGVIPAEESVPFFCFSCAGCSSFTAVILSHNGSNPFQLCHHHPHNTLCHCPPHRVSLSPTEHRSLGTECHYPPRNVTVPSLPGAGGDHSDQCGVPGPWGGKSTLAGRRAHEGQLPHEIRTLSRDHPKGPAVQERGKGPCGQRGACEECGCCASGWRGESLCTGEGGAFLGVQGRGVLKEGNSLLSFVFLCDLLPQCFGNIKKS